MIGFSKVDLLRRDKATKSFDHPIPCNIGLWCVALSSHLARRWASHVEHSCVEEDDPVELRESCRCSVAQPRPCPL